MSEEEKYEPRDYERRILELIDEISGVKVKWEWEGLPSGAHNLIDWHFAENIPFEHTEKDVAKAILEEYRATSSMGMDQQKYLYSKDSPKVTWMRGYIAACSYMNPILDDLSTPNPWYVSPDGERWQGGAFDNVPLWIRDSGYDRSYFREWGNVDELPRVPRLLAMYDKKKIDEANFSALKAYDEANKK
jgi:hypothetical protein